MVSKEFQLRCLLIIANRGVGNYISDFVKDYAHFQSIILGRGTATSEVRSALGIAEPEKDLIFCFIEKHNVEYVLKQIDDEFNFTKKHLGIALTIPVSSVAGISAFKVLTGTGNDNK